MSPYQVRLIVNPADGYYTAHWVEADGQQSEPFKLTLPLTQANANDLRWYLETYYQLPGAGDHKRAEGIERKLVGWGQDMFKAIFGGSEGTNVYRTLMAASEPRLLTLGATDPALLTQPWEMLRDRRGPLAFQGVIIRRQLLGSGRPRQYALQAPLRVLLIVSRPSDTGFIDPRISIPPILDALEALPPGQVQVDFCDPPTLAQLEQTVAQARRQQRPYHIVHFDGHGTYLPRTGVGALAFERDDGSSHLVTGTQLGDLLARLDVPLVLLEACRSSDLSDRPVFGSVAPALLDSGVGSVIAFSHAVHVQAARLLVERFYRELVAGQTIGQALLESRLALRADPARWLHLGPNAETVDLQDWFIPQLYQVGTDLAIVAPQPAGPGPSPILPSFGGQRSHAEASHSAVGGLYHFPPPPLYRFHGRALELLALERAFRRYPAVLVSGMGGMGKTALSREAAAWWLRTGRFEAAVFCTFEQKAGAERVVQLLGQALAGDAFSARPAEEQWAAAVDLFHRRRVLLVWDNFESTLPIYQREALPPTPAQKEGESASPPLGGTEATFPLAGGIEGGPTFPLVGGIEGGPLQFSADARARLHQLYRELTEGQPIGRLLITCRPAETGLPGLKEQPLEGLARPDSLHLLAAILDLKGITTDREGYEREAIEALLKTLDDHPLSIELVAPHLKNLPPARIQAEFGQLLDRFSDERATEGRNRSLLASLEFSKRRLSPEAQAILPTLAWFEGGVFEQFLLAFANLQPEAWQPMRDELVATALIRVEELEPFNTPYLHFHPTLPYAAARQTAGVSETPAVFQDAAARFIEVYRAVRKVARDALFGRQPAAGMALLAREEANLRAAITYAFRRGERQAAGMMADTLRLYLERAGRLRERDSLVAWVRANQPAEAGLDVAACSAILDHAWSLFTRGQAAEALQQVQGLIARLESEGLVGEEDPTFQLGTSYRQLSWIFLNAGRPDLVLEPAQKAIALLEKLTGDSARNNLSAALGDLANAYRNLGKLNAALETNKRVLIIQRELRRDQGVAIALGQIATILRQQQRYAEAETHYEEALQIALAARDLSLQGLLLQHQGILQDDLGHFDRAVSLYKQALRLFQQANNPGGEMQTCDLLATSEAQQGQLDAAEAWYARSRELAQQLSDQKHFVGVARNLGILYQNRAEQAPDQATRQSYLRQAIVFVKESLDGFIEFNDQVNAAASYTQLGVLYRLLGELEQAEKYMLQALQIHESLNLPEVYKDYDHLANITRDRGDEAAAARWQAKREAKVKELERLRRGEEAGEKLAELILTLAQAAYQVRVSGGSLEPQAAELLAQVAELPPPLGAVGPFLQAVAAGPAAGDGAYSGGAGRGAGVAAQNFNSGLIWEVG